MAVPPVRPAGRFPECQDVPAAGVEAWPQGRDVSKILVKSPSRPQSQRSSVDITSILTVITFINGFENSD